MLPTWLPLGLCLACYLASWAIALTRRSRPRPPSPSEGEEPPVEQDASGDAGVEELEEGESGIRWSRVFAIGLSVFFLILACVDGLLFFDYLRRPAQAALPPGCALDAPALVNPEAATPAGIVVPPDAPPRDAVGRRLEPPLARRIFEPGRSENVALKISLLAFAMLCVFFPLRGTRRALLLVHLSALTIALLFVAAFGPEAENRPDATPSRPMASFPSARRLSTVAARLLDPMKRFRQIFEGSEAKGTELYYALEDLHRELPRLRQAAAEYETALDPLLFSLAEGGAEGRTVLDELRRRHGAAFPALETVHARSRILWRTRFDGREGRSVRLSAKRAFVGAGAFDLATGGQLWTWPSLVHAAVLEVSKKDELFLRFSSTPPLLCRISPEIPVMAWSVPLRRHDVESFLALQDDLAGTISLDGTVTIFDGNTGTWLWTKRLASNGQPRILGSPGSWWVRDGRDRIHRFGLKDGKELSLADLGGTPSIGPAGSPDGSRVFLAVRGKDGADEMAILDGATGEIVGKVPLPISPRQLVPVSSDAILVRGEQTLTLGRWDGPARRITWPWRIRTKKAQVFAVSETLALISTTRRNLQAVALDDGRSLWEIDKLCDGVLVSARIRDGRLVASTNRGELLALHLGAAAPPATTVPSLPEESRQAVEKTFEALSLFRDFEPWTRALSMKLVTRLSGDDLALLIPVVPDLGNAEASFSLLRALFDRGGPDLRRAAVASLGGPLQKMLEAQTPPLELPHVDFPALSRLGASCAKRLPELVRDEKRVAALKTLLDDASPRVVHGAASLLALSENEATFLHAPQLLARVDKNSPRFAALLCALAAGRADGGKLRILTTVASAGGPLAQLAIAVLRACPPAMHRLLAKECGRKDVWGERARAAREILSRGREPGRGAR